MLAQYSQARWQSIACNVQAAQRMISWCPVYSTVYCAQKRFSQARVLMGLIDATFERNKLNTFPAPVILRVSGGTQLLCDDIKVPILSNA